MGKTGWLENGHTESIGLGARGHSLDRGERMSAARNGTGYEEPGFVATGRLSGAAWLLRAAVSDGHKDEAGSDDGIG